MKILVGFFLVLQVFLVIAADSDVTEQYTYTEIVTERYETQNVEETTSQQQYTVTETTDDETSTSTSVLEESSESSETSDPGEQTDTSGQESSSGEQNTAPDANVQHRHRGHPGRNPPSGLLPSVLGGVRNLISDKLKNALDIHSHYAALCQMLKVECFNYSNGEN